MERRAARSRLDPSSIEAPCIACGIHLISNLYALELPITRGSTSGRELTEEEIRV